MQPKPSSFGTASPLGTPSTARDPARFGALSTTGREMPNNKSTALTPKKIVFASNIASNMSTGDNPSLFEKKNKKTNMREGINSSIFAATSLPLVQNTASLDKENALINARIRGHTRSKSEGQGLLLSEILPVSTKKKRHPPASRGVSDDGTYTTTPVKRQKVKKAASTTKKSSTSLGPFSVGKQSKKAKLTPPRPPAAASNGHCVAKRVFPAKKSAPEGKDKYILRTSELEPSMFQLDLPSGEETIAHGKICQVIDSYMELGGVGFDFNSLVNRDGDAPSLSMPPRLVEQNDTSCEPVLSSLRNVVDDVSVEGFFREYAEEKSVGGRVEACVLSSQKLRQFIVCFRGSTDMQAKPVRGRNKYATLMEGPSSFLHPKHPVAVMPTFRDAYYADMLEENIFALLNRLAAFNPFCDVVMTGHSFGAAIATIGAFRYASLCPMIRVSCHAFGCPRVGGEKFRQLVHSLPNLKVIRVEHGSDPYVQMPQGPEWKHVGHSISLIPPPTTFSVPLMDGGSQGTDPKASQVLAYRFDKEKPGKTHSIIRSVDAFSIIGHGKEGCAITSYVDELEKLMEEGKQWVDKFVGMEGEGVSGKDDEIRCVV